MNKKLLTIAVVLVVFAIVAAPAAAVLPTKNPLPKVKPWDTVWTLLQDLQNQINNIPDGPQGDPGPAGADGISCWDLDGDGVNDPEEDINGDSKWDALDCQGPKGDAGDTGPAGADGATVHFGDWDYQAPWGYKYSVNSEYLAPTDGFVVVQATLYDIATEDLSLSGNTPAGGMVPLIKTVADVHPGGSETLMLPVRAGDKWEIIAYGPQTYPDALIVIFWLPLTP
jgi:hypothetical protein